MTKEQAINIAVEWWANKLKARLPHSNGDAGHSSMLACFLADLMTEDITDNQIDIFKRELRSRIEADMSNRFRQVYLGCDYHPSTNLRESAEAAGISKHNFPYKTDMYIHWDDNGEYGIRVYDGYGSPREELGV